MEFQSEVQRPEQLRGRRAYADELYALLDAQGKGYVGTGEVLAALASDLFLTSPHVAEAITMAAVRSRGHLSREDFCTAVLEVLPLPPPAPEPSPRRVCGWAPPSGPRWGEPTWACGSGFEPPSAPAAPLPYGGCDAPGAASRALRASRRDQVWPIEFWTSELGAEPRWQGGTALEDNVHWSEAAASEVGTLPKAQGERQRQPVGDQVDWPMVRAAAASEPWKDSGGRLALDSGDLRALERKRLAAAEALAKAMTIWPPATSEELLARFGWRQRPVPTPAQRPESDTPASGKGLDQLVHSQFSCMLRSQDGGPPSRSSSRPPSRSSSRPSSACRSSGGKRPQTPTLPGTPRQSLAQAPWRHASLPRASSPRSPRWEDGLRGGHLHAFDCSRGPPEGRPLGGQPAWRGFVQAHARAS